MKIILSYITATIILLFLLALPIAGVVAYIRLIRKMRREQITAIPKFSLFMLFLNLRNFAHGNSVRNKRHVVGSIDSGIHIPAVRCSRLVWNDSLAASAS